MLCNANDMMDCAIRAKDGTIGEVKDFYFDDEAWAIRYFVVETGSWLSSRKVLISPIAIGRPNWDEKQLPVAITKEQVKGSPDFDTEKPVSRQHEIRYDSYYGYPHYWDGGGLWGRGMYPNLMMAGAGGFVAIPSAVPSQTEDALADAEAARHRDDDPHLRSCAAVMGHHIEATDGDIGHVAGLLVDDETWAIRYLVVNTSNWWVGHDVLIAPHLIGNISWDDGTVAVKLTRQAVKDAPRYDPEAPPAREEEGGIYDYQGRSAYRVGEQTRTGPTPRP